MFLDDLERRTKVSFRSAEIFLGKHGAHKEGQLAINGARASTSLSQSNTL